VPQTPVAQTRSTPRHPRRPSATRDRLGQPHTHRATGRHPRRPRPHQPPDRRPALRWGGRHESGAAV